jgi:hypothetical protein
MGDMIINFLLMHTNPLLTGERFEPCISSALLASLMHFLALPILIDLILTPFHLPLMHFLALPILLDLILTPFHLPFTTYERYDHQLPVNAYKSTLNKGKI